jgi:hypothetical protein
MHFSVTVFDFDGMGNLLQGSYEKSFNGAWCTFAPVTGDPVKASAGVASCITYNEGGAPGNPVNYYVGETVEELTALANGGAS